MTFNAELHHLTDKYISKVFFDKMCWMSEHEQDFRQDVYEVLIRKGVYERINPSFTSYRSFLYQCVYNASKEVYRLKYRELFNNSIAVDNEMLAFIADAMEQGEKHSILDQLIFEEAINNASKGMSKRELEIIKYSVYEGYSNMEIVEHLNISKQRVSLVLCEFKERLKEELAA